MTPKDWKSRVAGLGCILCQHLGHEETPASLHHPRMGQGKGQRASDWLVIPLCKFHHQDPKSGIESGRFYQLYRLDEMDLLAMTIEQAVR